MSNTWKKHIGLVAVWVLAIFPIIVWLFMMPLATRFATSSTSLRSIGQIAGLLGMSLLSMNFILSARVQFIDKIFGGLNHAYTKHHTMGALSFSFILFHPIFLAVQYLSHSVNLAFDFLFGFGSWAVVVGEAGLFIFVALMVATFYMKMRYETWKGTHQYIGLVLLLGSVHMLFVPSDISANPILKYYMFLLALCGFVAYLYRTVLKLYKAKEVRYELKEVVKVNDGTVELKLRPLGRNMVYQPGQFIFIRFETEGVLKQSHPFSISSASDGELSIGVKDLGDYTKELCTMKPGLVCRIEGPFGTFTLNKAKSKRQIWVAGGIGITPFLGMARELVTRPDGYDVDLYYSVKNEKESAFLEELQKISQSNPHFRLHSHFSDTQGFITAGGIVNSDSDQDADFFLCGPLGFMKSLRRQLRGLGFNNNRIHSEEFNLSI